MSAKVTAKCRHKYLIVTGDSKFEAPPRQQPRRIPWKEHQPVRCEDCGHEFIRIRTSTG